MSLKTTYFYDDCELGYHHVQCFYSVLLSLNIATLLKAHLKSCVVNFFFFLQNWENKITKNMSYIFWKNGPMSLKWNGSTKIHISFQGNINISIYYFLFRMQKRDNFLPYGSAAFWAVVVLGTLLPLLFWRYSWAKPYIQLLLQF